MAANITFGNFPADMSDATSWGFSEFLGANDPVLTAFPTSTSLQMADPDTGTRLDLTGSFNVAALLAGDLATSSFSSGLMTTATGSLLFRGDVDPPIPLDQLFALDVDTFPLFVTGDDTIRGGAGNDILDGGPGSDTAVFAGARQEYTVQSSGRTLTVSGGSDGSDTLSAFEFLQFADQTIGLVPLPTDHPPDYGKDVGFLFDEVYYLLANPDLAGTVTPQDALAHYLGGGAAQGRDPNSWFDPAYYANRWQDLQALNLDDATLFVHYNLFGVWEGRSAGPKFDQFDGNRYLSDWPDVALYVDANVDDFLGSRSNGAIAHFIIYGADEQRLAYETTGALVDMGYVL